MQKLFGTLLTTLVGICGLVIGIAQAAPLPDCLPPVNAFTVGIGGAAVAVTDNPGVIFWNPAGFGVSEVVETDFTIASAKLELPASWSFLIANSASGGGKFGLAMIRRHSFKNNDEYKSFEMIFPLSHQFKAGMIPVGVSVKFISEQWEGSDWKSGMAFDTGMMFITPTGFKFGLTVKNISGSDLSTFRSQTWAGVSWGGEEYPILVSGQVRAERLRSRKYTTDNFNVGMNVTLFSWLPEIRTGWVRSAGEGRLTIGLCHRLVKSNAKIEYSFSTIPDGWAEKVHILTYGWGIKPLAPSLRGTRRGM